MLTLKLDAADHVSVFREATDGANGLAFDGAQRLYRIRTRVRGDKSPPGK